MAFTNLRDFVDASKVSRRAQQTSILGSGSRVAARVYRCFGCLCGIVLRRSQFERFDTERFDGSIFYQIYLAAKIIAAGGQVASIDSVIVAKDVQVAGQPANSYRDTLRASNARLTPKTGGLDEVGRVACEAILPHTAPRQKSQYILLIYSQLLLFSYAYWLYDYRRLGVYRASMNLAIGCWPPRLIGRSHRTVVSQAALILLYLLVTAAALTCPVGFLSSLTGRMSRISKRIRPSSVPQLT